MQGSELFEHGHDSGGGYTLSSGRSGQLLPGMVAPYSVLERSVSPSVFNIQVNLLCKSASSPTCIGVVNEGFHLAGLNEVFDAGRMVLNASKMQGSPPVIVAHVHVHTSQIGSLEGHLVPLDKRLKCIIYLIGQR